MKKITIHGLIIACVVVICDFGFNQGRASRAIVRDIQPSSLARDGRQAGAKFNSYVKRNTTSAGL